MWTDDQTRSYAGEDYEKVFIRTFLAICSLLQDGVDAEAYSLQINEKQMQLAESAAERLGEDFATKYSRFHSGTIFAVCCVKRRKGTTTMQQGPTVP